MDDSSPAAVRRVKLPSTLTRKSLRYFRKNYRYLAADPSFFWMKTAARFEVLRARSRRSTPYPSVAVSTEMLKSRAGIDDALAALEEDGYFVGLQLSPAAVDSLREQCATRICYGDRRADLPMYIHEREQVEARIGRPLSVANYFETQNDWPVFAALRDDPWLSSLARAYLGGDPVYLRSEIVWTFSRPRSRAQQIAEAHVFHCDINDFRTLKCFFYLYDVGPHGGPHEYIRKGPSGRKWIHQLMGQRVASLPEGELQRVYGADRVVSIQGKAGLGFIGDPYTYHRGGAPEEGSRLLLQIELGTRRYRTWYYDV